MTVVGKTKAAGRSRSLDESSFCEARKGKMVQEKGRWYKGWLRVKESGKVVLAGIPWDCCLVIVGNAVENGIGLERRIL